MGKQKRRTALELSKREMATQIEQNRAELGKLMRSVHQSELKLNGPQKPPAHGYDGENGQKWSRFVKRYQKLNSQLNQFRSLEKNVINPLRLGSQNSAVPRK